MAGGGEDWDGYELIEGTVRSLLPGWRRREIDGVEEVNLEGLAARLRQEIGDQASIMLYALVGAWTRLQA